MESALKLEGRIAPDHQEENMEIDSARDRTDLEDRRLILKARGGDVRALEELVYRYDEKVLSMAMSFVGNMDDAKDIYQEVFIRVFKGPAEIRIPQPVFDLLVPDRHQCLPYAPNARW